MRDWVWTYDDYLPERERLREALCTLGNGYFATRGAAPESCADEVHYPGTYLAGGFDRARSEVHGRTVENEDLVNLPNWLPLRLRFDGGDWLDLAQVEILSYRQTLDLQDGLLVREVRFREGGRETQLTQRRLVHMDLFHLAALETVVTPLGWSGTLEVESALDGTVTNSGVERYKALEGRHLEPLESEVVGEDGLFLRVRTRQSRLELAMAARTRVWRGETPVPAEPSVERREGWIGQRLRLDLRQDVPVTFEKLVSLYTSRDVAISECGLAAREAIARPERFAELLASHAIVWRQLWRRFDLELDLAEDDGGCAQRILRMHIFHLLVTAAPTVMDLDVGVPARGLHGEAYRGHIFWDELFIFPILNLRLPEVTRSLLLYRYRRLGAARRAAREAGLKGAMYPWQSGSDGREESQQVHLNPRSGRWTRDVTHLQRHVNSAIAYNVWGYYEATADTEFLSFYGAEMLLEIARFWASLATHNQETGRYEITNVVGPDEFHTGYPDREAPGVDNNAYTNLMAVWVITRALALPEHLPAERWEELIEHLAITQEELAHWDTVSRRMTVCFHGDGVISQFQGFERLAELDWEGYERRYGDIQRLDRILEAEDDTPNRYQATKQPDTLMLLYLFSAEQLERLFDRLGYGFDPETIPRTVAYYSRRTTHGSTLSRVIDAWVLARADRARSWHLFTEALQSDVADIQGGTTAEGIHLGAMAGTADLVQRCYTGIEIRDQHLWFNPALPDGMTALRIRVRFRGQTLEVRITHRNMRIKVISPEAETVHLGVEGKLVELAPGRSITLDLEHTPLYVDQP